MSKAPKSAALPPAGSAPSLANGGFYGSAPQDDGLAAIALPLLGKARVHGAINILWVKTAYSVEDFARRHLADLQAAAREIIASLPKARSLSSGPPRPAA